MWYFENYRQENPKKKVNRTKRKLLQKVCKYLLSWQKSHSKKLSPKNENQLKHFQ